MVVHRLPAASQLRSRARDARRQEREATRRGWDEVATLYATLADGIERLAVQGVGVGINPRTSADPGVPRPDDPDAVR